jgi:hypothetical protein
VPKKETKEEKLIDKRIERAYRRSCHGMVIAILDIPKVFAVGRTCIAEGSDDMRLEQQLRAYVESIMKKDHR